jgi:peptidoglycan/LPS O-acetylase OafA/YrhL
MDVGFRRLFWIGAAALLGVAALISIVALLRGEFTETDGKILGTLAAAFLAGSSSLAGHALIDRRDVIALAVLDECRLDRRHCGHVRLGDPR